MQCNLRNATYAKQSRQCNLRHAIYGKPPMPRNLCQAIYAMRSMHYNLYAMQSLQHSAKRSVIGDLPPSRVTDESATGPWRPPSRPPFGLVRCPFYADVAPTWGRYVPSQRQVSVNWPAKPADSGLTWNALRRVTQLACKSASSQPGSPLIWH